MAKSELKRIALSLRNEGLSYSEILAQVPVAKSTLSYWLRSMTSVGVQGQQAADRRCRGGMLGGAERKRARLALQERIYDVAKKEIGPIGSRELWLMGVILYWAEGAKEKEYRPGSGVEFTNSDAVLIRFFLKWIQEACGVDRERLSFFIFIHESHRDSLDVVRNYWGRPIGVILEGRITEWYE